MRNTFIIFDKMRSEAGLTNAGRIGTLSEVPPGTWGVSAAAPGKITKMLSITIASNQTAGLVFELKEGG
jgi:hypothetical protein